MQPPGREAALPIEATPAGTGGRPRCLAASDQGGRRGLRHKGCMLQLFSAAAAPSRSAVSLKRQTSCVTCVACSICTIRYRAANAIVLHARCDDLCYIIPITICDAMMCMSGRIHRSVTRGRSCFLYLADRMTLDIAHRARNCPALSFSFLTNRARAPLFLSGMPSAN